MDSKELINWGELSRVFSGNKSRQIVQRNKIADKYKPFVDELVSAMDSVISGWKLPEKKQQAAKPEPRPVEPIIKETVMIEVKNMANYKRIATGTYKDSEGDVHKIEYIKGKFYIIQYD